MQKQLNSDNNTSKKMDTKKENQILFTRECFDKTQNIIQDKNMISNDNFSKIRLNFIVLWITFYIITNQPLN